MLAITIDAFHVHYGANTYENTAFDWIQRHAKSLPSQAARALLVVMRQLSRTGAPGQMEADWADTTAARKTAASNFIFASGSANKIGADTGCGRAVGELCRTSVGSRV